MNHYVDAKEALQKIFRQLERINPTAARSLEEGLEETLTVHRLGIGGVLRRKLATTNPIESCLSTVQRVARNVKRWREGDQPLRWTATGLLEAEKKFRRIKGSQGKAESVSHSAEGGPDSRSRLNRGCYRSSEMEIVSPRGSWRAIFSRKTEIVTRKEKRAPLRSLTGQEKRLTVPNIESRCNQLKLGHLHLWFGVSFDLIGQPFLCICFWAEFIP
jgi:hypothetical protein